MSDVENGGNNTQRTEKSITVDATIANVETVTDFVNAELEALDCPMKAQMQIDVAIDELFGNIAHYAYKDHESGKPGMANVEVSSSKDEPPQVVITFTDCGIPYNPLENEDPDVTLSAEERKIGGLGIFLVKKTMDDISYEYKDGKNILTIKKNL
jgi:anti-sigma regulatory factor (Ser/Thr protein kinase)